MRSKIAELKEFMTPQEFETFLDQFRDIEQWIEAENSRSLSTAEDLDLYRVKLLRIYEYETAFKTLRARKDAG